MTTALIFTPSASVRAIAASTDSRDEICRTASAFILCTLAAPPPAPTGTSPGAYRVACSHWPA
jgi:hypothetical protein